ncbi:MAG: hypothetical protein A2Z21_06095 [Candidatus Fraserbacteria bacterium RBG_16_55_9]|uniref:AAA+ ATPase domain-containing protein n=1 Tax=Fraserbacteria sp. (strain RBG_16_55_9) TaxID=1817864 RepID=A0A1F5V2C9_FRAXR|nr:MAG: hypothetical protein A2Z21_06095 [Candidatus Fraserbacteria bacterium RBG_16_55_9]
MEMIEGTLEHIVYRSESDGFTVAYLASSDQTDQFVTIVGNLLAVSPGENLVLKGQWAIHPKYGRQFEVHDYHTVLPTTEAGLQKYLGSGLIKGIGPALATRIIECFREDTLRILDEQRERLLEVKGIGPHKLQQITRAWDEQKEIREVMLFLKAHDVSTGYATKIFKTYGREAIRIVQENPYQLAEDIFGIGFKIADRIALKLGLARDAPQRIEAALLYALEEAANEGHVYLPRAELAQRCMRMLELEESEASAFIESAVERLIQRARVMRDHAEGEDAGEQGEVIYLPPFYYGELGVAHQLKQIKTTPIRVGHEKVSQLLSRLTREAAKVGHTYSSEQEEAIRAALLSKAVILTGGPGTGKTTTVRGILQMMEWLGWTVLLAAPTGRAAKRLSEATGREAFTIHRLLGYRPPRGFEFYEDNKLDADAVIIDELSMVDLLLMNHLVKALPPEAHLILVGDADQLPSVGPGNVLHDLIQSGEFAVIRLSQIFRQAQESRIVVNAHLINQGQFPYLEATETSDFFFLKEEDPEQAAQLICQLVTQRLPQFYKYDPFQDIQVLSPMYRGASGVENLNQLLQERLNPSKSISLPGSQRELRLGDKVMQVRNNYEKEVFNGDIGRIVDVNLVEQQLWVRYPDRGLIPYDAADLNELVMAYAVTIHKSQGSEYKSVIMPILTHHYVMLQRNLLYTGITRAKELVVLVGSKRALGMAVRNDKQQLRYSRLAKRLARPG